MSEIVENAIQNTGWGLYSRFQIVVCISCGFVEGLAISSIALAFPMSVCDLQATTKDIIDLNSNISIGMAIGSLAWGLLLDVIGRAWSNAFGLVIIFAGTFACSLSLHMISHQICACIIGVGISGLYISSRLFLMENIAKKNRGAYVTLIDLSSAIAYSIATGLSIAVEMSPLRSQVNGFRLMSWRVIFGIVGFLNVMVASLTTLLQGNQRYLYYEGLVRTAEITLMRTFALNMSLHADRYPNPGYDRSVQRKSNIQRLINIFLYLPTHFGTFILCTLASLTMFPNSLSVHFWLHKIVNNPNRVINGTDIYNQTTCIVNALSLFWIAPKREMCPPVTTLDFVVLAFAPIIGLIFVVLTVDRFGRKNCTIICSIIICICCLCIANNPSSKIVLLVLGVVIFACHTAAKTTLTLIILENFPTGVRATILGFTRFPAFMMSAIINRFVYVQCSVSLFIVGPIFLVTAASTYFLKDYTRRPICE